MDATLRLSHPASTSIRRSQDYLKVIIGRDCLCGRHLFISIAVGLDAAATSSHARSRECLMAV